MSAPPLLIGVPRKTDEAIRDRVAVGVYDDVIVSTEYAFSESMTQIFLDDEALFDIAASVTIGDIAAAALTTR